MWLSGSPPPSAPVVEYGPIFDQRDTAGGCRPDEASRLTDTQRERLWVLVIDVFSIQSIPGAPPMDPRAAAGVRIALDALKADRWPAARG